VLPGGEAFNTAIALAGWDVPVLLTGTALGTDAESGQLRALLDDPAFHNLDRTLLPDAWHTPSRPFARSAFFPTASGR
jgi:hypothetical protein